MEISKSCKESKERKTGQIISVFVGSGLTMRGLNNTSSSHSGLDLIWSSKNGHSVKPHLPT
jgi:hypothetical protein